MSVEVSKGPSSLGLASGHSLIRVSVLCLSDELVVVAAHRYLLHSKVFSSSRLGCRDGSSLRGSTVARKVVSHLGIELLSGLWLGSARLLWLELARLSDSSSLDTVLCVWLRNSRLGLSFGIGTALG